MKMNSPLEAEEEVEVDKQLELTSFLLLTGTTTPSSEYIDSKNLNIFIASIYEHNKTGEEK